MTRTRSTAGAIASVLLLLAPSMAQAQGLRFHGLLDLALSGRGPGFQVNGQTYGDSPFDPWGLRVFCDGAISPNVSIFTQGVLHDPSAPYVEGAYVLLKTAQQRDLSLMAGKIPWPIGTYAPRSYSDKNPLVGKPLLYQYHTTLTWYSLPSGPDQLIAEAGQGQTGAGNHGPGMPVVDDSYWDTGAVLLGSKRPLEGSFGFTTGTPGWGNNGMDENHGKTLLGRVGVVPIPGIRAGVSGAYGAYLDQSTDPDLPPGKKATDYHQKLIMADAEWTRGHIELRAEGYLNAWESPNVGDLGVRGAFLEAVVTVAPGLAIAARGEGMRFSDIQGSSGVSQPWDHHRDRYEAGLNYRFERAVRIKTVWQHNVMRLPGAESARHDLMAAQLSVSF